MLPVHILIVDDEEHVLRQHASLLEEFHNVEVDTVERAYQAIELLSSGEIFDLVLSDILNIASDADDLLRVAHLYQPALPFVIIIDAFRKEAFLKSHDCSSVELLIRPVRWDDLLAAVNRSLEACALK